MTLYQSYAMITICFICDCNRQHLEVLRDTNTSVLSCFCCWWRHCLLSIIVYFPLSFFVVFMLLASAGTLHLPYLTSYLPTFRYLTSYLTSYLTFHYLNVEPYLTLHFALPYLTLYFAFHYLTLPYLISYFMFCLTLPYLLLFLTLTNLTLPYVLP